MDEFKRKYNMNNFSLDIFKEAIKQYMESKAPITDSKPIKVSKPLYIEMTREEILSLKDGDICYINSSWGMQKCVYPNLDGDTHRNMFGKGGSNKTIEEKRDWGAIYKINPDYDNT